MADLLTATVRAPARPRVEVPARGLVDLADVPLALWQDLAERALAPNAYYHPAWARAVAAHARGRTGAKALLAWSTDGTRLTGFLPVVPAARVLHVPLPLLIAWQAYGRLATPLIDREAVEEAVAGLLEAAAVGGARALFVPDMAASAELAGVHRALARRGMRVLRRHERARLDASGEAEPLLRQALGAKKLKDLRRQRQRLADGGALAFEVATTPPEVAAALERFLVLEASGWKGARGTALAQDAGDAAFIRSAAPALAAAGCCRIVTLARAGVAVAAGIVLVHGTRAFFFKIAYDQALAKMSPGVQLTVDFTRHLCADPAIRDADSTADANHPMIDHIWRARLPLADVLVPTRGDDALTSPLEWLIVSHHIARTGARAVVQQIRLLRENHR